MLQEQPEAQDQDSVPSLDSPSQGTPEVPDTTQLSVRPGRDKACLQACNAALVACDQLLHALRRAPALQDAIVHVVGGCPVAEVIGACTLPVIAAVENVSSRRARAEMRRNNRIAYPRAFGDALNFDAWRDRANAQIAHVGARCAAKTRDAAFAMLNAS